MTDPRERKVIHVGSVGDSLSDGASPRPSARQRLLERELGSERPATDADDAADEDDDVGDDGGALLASRMRDDDEDADIAARAEDALDADADDASEDDAESEGDADDDDDDDDDEPPHDDGVQIRERKTHAVPRRGRSPLFGPAPMLLLGASVLWGGAMLLRCRPGTELPPAALPEPAAGEPAPEAADAPPLHGDDAAPIPMGERSGGPPDEPGDAQDEPDAEVPSPRDDWPEGLEIPETIRYTIRRGGSLENVANLFKIYHHEILAMNPGIGLEQELAPNTRVVVYQRDPEVASESIGFPSGGTLAGAMPMVEGKGRRILAIPWKTWGTTSTIAMLDRVLDRWAARGDVQDILVGNISNRTGGRLEPHSTHQSGRDVDLGYPQMLAKGGELSWQEMNERNLDAAETWALLKMLVETRSVEEVYIDRSLQKLLHEHAVKTGVVPKSSLGRWMEYPRPTGQGGTVIKHVAGHSDHLHVRFACAKGQSRCKSR